MYDYVVYNISNPLGRLHLVFKANLTQRREDIDGT